MLGPSLPIKKKNESTPPLGLKRLVPNCTFLSSSLERFPLGAQHGGGESAQCSEKQQSPCEGIGGPKD